MPHAKYKLCYVAWRGLMRVCVSPPLSSVLVSVLIIICAHQNVVNQHTDLAKYSTWIKCSNSIDFHTANFDVIRSLLLDFMIEFYSVLPSNRTWKVGPITDLASKTHSSGPTLLSVALCPVLQCNPSQSPFARQALS